MKNQEEIARRIKEASYRALLEAEERAKHEKLPKPKTEFGGREGPEPTRFGDWERKGIAIDF